MLWNSAAFSTDVRADALRETIREHVVNVELKLPPVAEQVRAQVSLFDVGRVRVCSVEAMPTTVTRTPRHGRADEEPMLFLTLQVSGTSLMVQHDRYASLGPGQFAVYVTTTPYTLLFERGVHAHFFRFPLRDLALPDQVVEEASARPFGRDGNHVAALTSTYLSRLGTIPNAHDGEVRDGLAVPTIELVRAALTSAATNEGLAREAAAVSLDTRILEYVRTHLGDAALSPSTIAAAQHISVRQLYTVMSRAGISLADWIRTERLERCRRDLARPGLQHRTVAAVAAVWGFADATHFARVFRDAYGLSPREWRRLRLAAPDQR